MCFERMADALSPAGLTGERLSNWPVTDFQSIAMHMVHVTSLSSLPAHTRPQIRPMGHGSAGVSSM